MPYKQSNNPISRKTSPLRDKGNHPHPHNKPGVISIESPETARTSVHPESEHNPPLEGQPYPNPDFYERQSDMEESGADQPDYESDDYKPGMSRKSSSPLNAEENKEEQIARMRADQAKKKAEKHKRVGKGPSRRSSSPLNEIKPENRGKFTKWAKARGMTAAQAASKVMGDTGKYSSEVVKMANFAKNAQSW